MFQIFKAFSTFKVTTTVTYLIPGYFVANYSKILILMQHYQFYKQNEIFVSFHSSDETGSGMISFHYYTNQSFDTSFAINLSYKKSEVKNQKN